MVILSLGFNKGTRENIAIRVFVRCHNCYLVNIKYVDEIDSNFVQIYDAKIPISRARKQDFMQKVLDYYKRNF